MILLETIIRWSIRESIFKSYFKYYAPNKFHFQYLHREKPKPQFFSEGEKALEAKQQLEKLKQSSKSIHIQYKVLKVFQIDKE